MRSSLSDSPSSILPTGMPVHEDTTSATSSGPTSSLSIEVDAPASASAFSASVSCFSSSGMRP